MSKSGRAAARERIRLEREREARRRQRNRVLVVVGSALAAIVIAVIIIVVVRPGQSTGTGTATAPVHSAYYNGPFAPVTKNPDHSVTMSRPAVTKPVLDIYEDFQCPVCDAFEKANGAVVQKLAFQGKVRVIYHPFTIFLGEQPAQDNSVRAWAAAQCVPARQWMEYHNLLYSNQPGERAQGGFPISLLLALGRKIGLTSPSFTGCVKSQKYASLGVPLSERIVRSGINSTPTVKLDGKTVSNAVLVQPGNALEKLIQGAS
ncbi:MAG: DsbA family protein [Streptosporangiaceae bacterium]